jgi:hypothetical protein
MREFKFNCPACGQHILADVDWIGNQMSCPSCETRILIPSPERVQDKEPPVLRPGQKARPRPLGKVVRGRGTKRSAKP